MIYNRSYFKSGGDRVPNRQEYNIAPVFFICCKEMSAEVDKSSVRCRLLFLFPTRRIKESFFDGVDYHADWACLCDKAIPCCSERISVLDLNLFLWLFQLCVSNDDLAMPYMCERLEAGNSLKSHHFAIHLFAVVGDYRNPLLFRHFVGIWVSIKFRILSYIKWTQEYYSFTKKVVTHHQENINKMYHQFWLPLPDRQILHTLYHLYHYPLHSRPF